jgi:2-methylcitrate dehydratase PrpD
MTILNDAINFANSITFNDFDDEMIEICKRALVDYVGVVLAGCETPVSRNIQTYAKKHSATPQSRIFGTEEKVSWDLAALANGVAGHALDFDDTSWTTIGHPTVTVAPVVFSAGEVMNISGRQALKAYAVGVEIQNKIATLVMPEASSNGWHTTSVFGPFGAVTASALIIGLGNEEFLSALGIAASMASGIRSNFGTMTKAYHAGMASFNGATAVILADLGIAAAKTAIEAPDGFIQIFSGKKSNPIPLSFGAPWDIVKPGLVFKRYPCCSGTHPATDCILNLLKETPFRAEDVESINVGVSQLGMKELVCHRPKTPTEARFSMEYALCSAIVYGKLGLSEFTLEAVNDPRIKALVPKVFMETDLELAELGFIGTAPAKLRVMLKNGRVLEDSRNLAKGNPELPLSDEELSDKFMECASKVLDLNHCRKALKALLEMEKIQDINLITRLLR